MKKIFSSENITTFVLVTIAAAVAFIFVVPIMASLKAKFLPTASTTATTATTS